RLKTAPAFVRSVYAGGLVLSSARYAALTLGSRRRVRLDRNYADIGHAMEWLSTLLGRDELLGSDADGCGNMQRIERRASCRCRENVGQRSQCSPANA